MCHSIYAESFGNRSRCCDPSDRNMVLLHFAQSKSAICPFDVQWFDQQSTPTIAAAQRRDQRWCAVYPRTRRGMGILRTGRGLPRPQERLVVRVANQTFQRETGQASPRTLRRVGPHRRTQYDSFAGKMDKTMYTRQPRPSTHAIFSR